MVQQCCSHITKMLFKHYSDKNPVTACEIFTWIFYICSIFKESNIWCVTASVLLYFNLEWSRSLLWFCLFSPSEGRYYTKRLFPKGVIFTPRSLKLFMTTVDKGQRLVLLLKPSVISIKIHCFNNRHYVYMYICIYMYMYICIYCTCTV